MTRPASIKTTCIGAYPKPGFVTLPDWFSANDPSLLQGVTRSYGDAVASLSEDALEEMLLRGVGAVIRDQVDAGIDIPTDGEIPRENYLHYHCRHLDGISFDELTRRALRDEAYSAAVPTWVGPIAPKEHFLPQDFVRARACTERPVKMTIPGPLSLAESTADAYYFDRRKLGAALAEAINVEVRALAAAGCKHIQIDEPVFARLPDRALSHGIDDLERCFHGVPRQVERIVHICCGYPYALDQPDYPKAPLSNYYRLARALDEAQIDAVSIEDAHRPNDLRLLEEFTVTKVLLGVVKIASSKVESAEDITMRLKRATEHIDRHRLEAAPDCGLGYLGRDLARQKLACMCAAAARV